MAKLIKNGKRMKIKGLLGKETVITEGKIKDRYGYIPKSIWDITKSKELTRLVKDDSMERYRDGNGKQPLSEFNPDIAKRCLQIWSDEGDKVLDPFMNRGTTSIIAAYFGRQGYGNEIVESYYDNVDQRVKELIASGKEWAKNIHLTLGDAKDFDTNGNLSEFFDYIYTSPPYWNVERYESCDGQLSDIKTYEAFLVDYGFIIEILYEILKPNKFVTYVVNDFRRNGKYHWFSGDTITLFMAAGFELWDVVINVIRTPFVSGVDNAVRKQRRTVKYHEYVLTFKKVVN